MSDPPELPSLRDVRRDTGRYRCPSCGVILRMRDRVRVKIRTKDGTGETVAYARFPDGRCPCCGRDGLVMLAYASFRRMRDRWPVQMVLTRGGIEFTGVFPSGDKEDG